MGQFVEGMDGYVREVPAESARPISVFDMQAAPAAEKPVAPVKPAAKAADPEGSKK